MEPPPVQENHPAVENGKVSSNGASAEKEDSKSDKTAAAEQTVEPEAAGSDSKISADNPAKKANDGHSDEPDKKQPRMNDDSPRAADSIRYSFLLTFHFI